LAGVRVDIRDAPPWHQDDAAATFRPESARALQQTRKAFA
jgi:hypothetical protein